MVEQIYTWRVLYRLSVRAITTRLNADPAAYPPPDGRPYWTQRGVTVILANPKYTGHMVYGRTRKNQGRKLPVPAGQWIWSPEPTHPAIISRQTWDAAQKVGAERGNVRDAETPTARQGRHYVLRSRIRHNACQRRMCGTWRQSSTGATYTYYKCPHDPTHPGQAAAYPDHGTVALREDTLIAAIAGFFDQYVFGHDRADRLAAQLPATTAEHAEARTRQQAHLRGELARIDTAEHGLITELEAPADPGDPAAQAYRARIRARYAELYAERTATEAKLTALQADTPQDNDLSLLDLLPVAAGLFTDAPARIRETLLTAFDIQVLVRSDQHQVTIWATLTDDTPRTITALLDDPRTDSDTGTPAPGQDPVYHSAPAPIAQVSVHDHSRSPVRSAPAGPRDG